MQAKRKSNANQMQTKRKPFCNWHGHRDLGRTQANRKSNANQMQMKRKSNANHSCKSNGGKLMAGPKNVPPAASEDNVERKGTGHL
jgi:hypothetical protein